MSARFLLLLGTLGTISLAGCGGTDPLTALQSTPVYPLIPSVSLPVNPNTLGFEGVLPYTGGTPYLTFEGWTLQASIVSPATGLVSYVNQNGSPSQVNITVNSHLTVILKGNGLVSTVVAGTLVTAGTAIATLPQSFAGFQLQMQINLDGTAVCPMSFLTSAAKTAILNIVGGSFNMCTS